MQFAWNIRAVLTEWAARPPTEAVTPDLLQSVFDRVTGRARAGGALAVQRLLPPPAHIRTALTFLVPNR